MNEDVFRNMCTTAGALMADEAYPWQTDFATAAAGEDFYIIYSLGFSEVFFTNKILLIIKAFHFPKVTHFSLMKLKASLNHSYTMISTVDLENQC